jgi:hypothetical protein
MHAVACYWADAHCLSWARLLSDLISSDHEVPAVWKRCSNVFGVSMTSRASRRQS